VRRLSLQLLPLRAAGAESGEVSSLRECAMPCEPSCPTLPITYELRFESLFHNGRAFAFPCDAVGRVSLDHLSERGRTNYLFARAVVGRDLGLPFVALAPAV
jgi:hypothetical protein